MARRSSYSGGSFGNFANIGRVYWPKVITPAFREYVSVLEPRVSAGYPLEPDHLKIILRPSAVAAVHLLRSKIDMPATDQPRLSGTMPTEPTHPGIAPTPIVEPKWELFEPKKQYSGWFEGVKDVLSGAATVRETDAKRKFEAATASWKLEGKTQQRVERNYRDSLQRYETDIADYRRQKASLESDLGNALERFKSHARRCKEAQSRDTEMLEALIANATSGKGGIEALAAHILQAVPLPRHFAQEIEAQFDAESGILLFSMQAPNIEEVGLQVQLKTKARPATEREIRAAQEYVVHALSLRLIHEVFATPELSKVTMVGVNVRLRYTDRHNGKRMDEVIGSLAATRAEFQNINIANVDPRLCFRSLKGVSAPSFQDLSAVRPILTFDTADKRIVEGREIVDKLEAETNLAAMDWEDFEHVVRELFAKMFSARSEAAEVHVTRASRDYGVDALIHDPDPIHGGKFVIQAKRYVNTVEVAAVRDLFGTVQNEGANRGYLVTTSFFGPDAYAFAKGKPLSLIDGTHLLHLLKEHGYSFRINLKEAREMLHGR